MWDFYGYEEVLTPDGVDLDRYIHENSNESLTGAYKPFHRNMLTVNAIDGSVIDRSLGY